MRFNEVLDNRPSVGVTKLSPHDDVVMCVWLETDEDLAPGHVLMIRPRDFLFHADIGGGGRGDIGGVVDAFVENGAGAG